jgi:hypothetical protein
VPAHALDQGAYDIEAHAAPRDLADRIACGEAGQEDHVEQIGLVRHLGVGDQASRPGAGAHRRKIHPAAIVAQADAQVVAAHLGVERHATDLGLAGGGTHVGHLNAVIDRVAQQVEQRLAQLVEHLAVGLSAAVIDEQLDALSGVASHLAELEAQGREECGEGLHAGAPHLIVDSVSENVDVIACANLCQPPMSLAYRSTPQPPMGASPALSGVITRVIVAIRVRRLTGFAR